MKKFRKTEPHRARIDLHCAGDDSIHPITNLVAVSERRQHVWTGVFSACISIMASIHNQQVTFLFICS